MKKTRILVLSTLLVLGGVLLSACGGQVIATGAPGVTVQGDRAYLASGGYVYSIDLATGQEATTTDEKGKVVPLRFPLQSRNVSFGSMPAAVSETQMVIGNAFSNNRKHDFYSFDPQTMAAIGESWPFEGAENLWMGSPIVLNGIIYAPNSDGDLYAFNPDGTLLDKFVTGESIWAQPVTDGELLYVASMDHSVYAVDPADLSEARWQTELDASIVSAVTVLDGKIYAGTINDSLYALDAATGDIVWHATLDGGIWGSPALAGVSTAAEAAPTEAPTADATSQATPVVESAGSGEVLYVGTGADSEGGTLYAISTEDGSTVWTHPTAAAIAAAPIVHDNIIYFVTEDGMIQAVTADQKPAGQARLEGQLFTAPVLAGDLLLVAVAKNPDILLAAYTLDGDLSDGDLKWAFPPAKK